MAAFKWRECHRLFYRILKQMVSLGEIIYECVIGIRRGKDNDGFRRCKIKPFRIVTSHRRYTLNVNMTNGIYVEMKLFHHTLLMTITP